VTVDVVVADASVTAPLRRVVLRPHQPVEEVAASGQDGAGAVHVAARIGDAVVGSGSVRREAPPWDPSTQGAWRLRGMATDPDRRSQGIGAAVLAALLDQVRDGGGRLVWCSARTPARSFYERAGFVATGEPWVDPLIGPHVHMWRDL
jgi:GNAT superfamily N-acetyltransferase